MRIADRLNTVVSIGVIVFAAYYFLRPQGPVGGAWNQWREERRVRARVGQEWAHLLEAGSRPESATGEVVLVAFSDYQCPFCRESDRVLREVLEEQGGGVSYRHFPMTSLHPAAEEAARAAICAERQGRFAEMHRWLFDNPAWQQRRNWGEGARDVGIRDTAAFRTCLHDRATSDRLAADIRLARRLGIVGTPSFVHRNGITVGAVPKDQMRALLAP